MWTITITGCTDKAKAESLAVIFLRTPGAEGLVAKVTEVIAPPVDPSVVQDLSAKPTPKE